MVLACGLSLSAQRVTEYFNVGNPISYCATDYWLAWSARPQTFYYVQEYLPQGETLEHYNQLFTVSVLFWDLTPEQAVEAKIAELEQRKASDPVVNYKVAENGDGEYILEFVVSDTNNGEISTVEVDIHYYKQMTLMGRKASVLYFYSCRAYDDDILPFIQSIPERRAEWYNGIIGLNLVPDFKKK